MSHRSVSIIPKVERIIRISEAAIVKHIAGGDFSLALNLLILARVAHVLATVRQLTEQEAIELIVDYIDGTRQITESELSEHSVWVEKIAKAYSKRHLKR